MAAVRWTADDRELRALLEQRIAVPVNMRRHGNLIAMGGDRWVLHVPAEEVTPDRCVQLVRAAAGLADLAVEIVSVLPWRAAARVADRFREGRAFLVGDRPGRPDPAARRSYS